MSLHCPKEKEKEKEKQRKQNKIDKRK